MKCFITEISRNWKCFIIATSDFSRIFNYKTSSIARNFNYKTFSRTAHASNKFDSKLSFCRKNVLLLKFREIKMFYNCNFMFFLENPIVKHFSVKDNIQIFTSHSKQSFHRKKMFYNCNFGFYKLFYIEIFRLVDTNFQNAMWIEWSFLFLRSSNGILWIVPHVTYCTVLSIYFLMEKIFFQIIKRNRLHLFCHANWSGTVYNTQCNLYRRVGGFIPGAIYPILQLYFMPHKSDRLPSRQIIPPHMSHRLWIIDFES